MSYLSTHSALLTDLYQLTMAQAYFHSGLGETSACFHLSFRDNPFGSGFSVACGVEPAIDWLTNWEMTREDADFLAKQRGADGQPLFSAEFLGRMVGARLECDVDAVAEGTIVFPGEPLMRVSGPLPHCQLAETALLTMVNFETLIATKAARCRIVAGEDRLVEFGLRRAQGVDGGISASRASYVGGFDGTSNVIAAQVFDIPVSGTHAHSWVMAFDSELEAFEAYAEALPNNVTLLVDTYNTLEGVRRAVEVGRGLRERGQQLLAIRIDSGDLAWLSRMARDILDEAGFSETKIVASNELDEHLIASLKEQRAAIDIWGVGTKLVTGWGQPALGGVYKLSAIRRDAESWIPRIKVSEQLSKVTTPGVLGVRRYRRGNGSWAGDMIYDIEQPPSSSPTMIDPNDATRRKTFDSGQTFEDLLRPVVRRGRRVDEPEPLSRARERAMGGLGELDPSIKRFLNPHDYPVGLERHVHDLRSALVMAAKGISAEEAIPSRTAVEEARAVIEPRKDAE